MHSTHSPVSRSLRSLGAVALLAAASTADVWIVDAAGAGDFLDLPAAVAAASDGDTLIVRDGNYAAFATSGKGLRVVAERDADPRVTGSIRILGLAQGREFVLSGLIVTAPYTTDPALMHAVTVFDAQGALRVQDCLLTGARNANSSSSEPLVHDGDGGSGIVFVNAADAILTRCTLVGGRGHQKYDCCDFGGDGGEGLFSSGSTVALYDCSAIGGVGGYSGWGGPGGPGAILNNFGIFASGSTFTGGAGGLGDDFIFGPGGEGGDGLVVGAAAQAQLRDNQYVGGAGGPSFLGQIGMSGSGLVGLSGSVITQLPGAARRFTASPSAWEGSSLAVQVVGLPGDRVWFPGSQQSDFRFAPSVSGVWALKLPVKMLSEPQGIIPASGTLELLVPLTALPPGVAADLRHYQGYVISTSGKPFVGTPLSLLRLDCNFSPDCDGSGVPDACEIQSGAVSDCNHNGIPDSCDVLSGLLPDCNQNGVADLCDILGGASVDCDADQVPDECQYDCNQNGIADICDVLAGSSVDCDSNLVPDECDADCNANGTPDACDIAAGTSLDSNGNGVPDECQSAADVYLVDDDGPPYGADGSAAKPFDTLQKAFDYALSGNTLIVRDGLYVGPENRGVAFAGRDLTVVSQNGAANCVIDCQAQGRAFVFDPGTTLAARLEGLTIRNGDALDAVPEPSRGGGVLVQTGAAATLADCVIEFCNGRTYGGGVYVSSQSDAVLEGCNLRSNSATGSNSQGVGGGGLSSFGSPSTGTLYMRACLVTDNIAFQGGGLMLGSGHARIEQCIVQGNQKTPFGFGGGIWHLGTGSVDVLGSRIADNLGGSGGGAFYSESKGAVRLSHCVVAGNVCGAQGGAIGLRNFFMPTMTATVENCLITGNQGGEGGGLFAVDVPQLTVRDCTIAGNKANQGGAVYLVEMGQASLENCILWGNDGSFLGDSLLSIVSPISVSWCDVEGGLAGTVAQNGGSFLWGAGNLALDPLFIDPDGFDNLAATWGDNDYRLAAGSPCVDAGNNLVVSADLFDLDGDFDFLEPVPIDLDLLPRFVDDPGVPDTGVGAPPLIDLGSYERP